MSENQRTRYCCLCETRKSISEWTMGQPYCNTCQEVKEYEYYTEENKPKCCGKVVTSDAMSKRLNPLHHSYVWMCCNCGKILGRWKHETTPKQYIEAQERKNDDRYDHMSKPMTGLL